jgi:glycosyltransferase involved in cell wall biosynthesis
VAETPYTRRLRVALVDPSGYTRPYDHELARALARRGHDVSLWTASFVHGDPPPADGYRVRELFYRRTNRMGGPQAVRRAAKAGEHLAGLWELRGRLLADGADVVHVQWAVLRPVERTFYGRLQREGTPVVFTAHDPIPNVGGDRRRRSVAATARVFARVIVHSEWGRAALVDRCGVAENRVRVIPHGVFGYLAELPPIPSPADPSGPMVLLPGLIRPYKGTDVLLAAWPRVRAAVPTAELVIAGRPMMDIGALRLDQPGVTAIPRFVSDAELAALLRRADVVTLPYRSIDNSGVVFSALALGAGLVLSSVGGFRELHERDGVGALVPPGDPSALAATLIEVLTSATRRDALRAASRSAAEGRLSWGEIAEATESVYREVV